MDIRGRRYWAIPVYPDANLLRFHAQLKIFSRINRLYVLAGALLWE